MVMWGIDRLSGGQLSAARKRLRSSSSALLSHSAATDRNGNSVLKVLGDLGIEPSLLLSPEHGFDGVAQAEEPVSSLQDQREGDVRVLSLYGNDKTSLAPTAEQLEGIETLVIDLVDVGSRYYTYAWTALMTLRAAAAAGVHSLILDRPNPLGGNLSTCEGKVQHHDFLSFVGLEPVPIRHGLSLAEMLLLHAKRDGLQLGPDGAASVIGTWGWERGQLATAWGRPFIPPSPNMPTLETALLYPGGCLVEGTNLSEGRGTSFPFRVIGAPFLDGPALASALRDALLPGVVARPICFKPSFEKHAGQVCNGVMLHVTDPVAFKPVMTYLTLLSLAQTQAPDQFRFLDRTYEFESDRCAFDLLTGSPEVREAMHAGSPASAICDSLCPIGTEWDDQHEAAQQLVSEASA